MFYLVASETVLERTRGWEGVGGRGGMSLLSGSETCLPIVQGPS